jgi:hypothetical protein
LDAEQRKIKEIKESMGQTFYVVDNLRRPNALVRRDLLKVDPPSAAEAQSRAEEDERTTRGRPLGGGKPKAKAKVKAKAKARPKGRRLGG